VTILYFAWLRERLNRASDTVDLPPEIQTIADLLLWLAARDEAFALAMNNKPGQFKVSLDARIRSHDTPLAGTTIVAILPPMTGG
jgi:sulfur-carrier protein